MIEQSKWHTSIFNSVTGKQPLAIFYTQRYRTVQQWSPFSTLPLHFLHWIHTSSSSQFADKFVRHSLWLLDVFKSPISEWLTKLSRLYISIYTYLVLLLSPLPFSSGTPSAPFSIFPSFIQTVRGKNCVIFILNRLFKRGHSGLH